MSESVKFVAYYGPGSVRSNEKGIDLSEFKCVDITLSDPEKMNISQLKHWLTTSFLLDPKVCTVSIQAVWTKSCKNVLWKLLRTDRTHEWLSWLALCKRRRTHPVALVLPEAKENALLEGGGGHEPGHGSHPVDRDKESGHMHNLTEEGEYGRAGDIDPDSSDEYSDGEAQSDLAYSVVSARRHAAQMALEAQEEVAAVINRLSMGIAMSPSDSMSAWRRVDSKLRRIFQTLRRPPRYVAPGGGARHPPYPSPHRAREACQAAPPSPKRPRGPGWQPQPAQPTGQQTLTAPIPMDAGSSSWRQEQEQTVVQVTRPEPPREDGRRPAQPRLPLLPLASSGPRMPKIHLRKKPAAPPEGQGV